MRKTYIYFFIFMVLIFAGCDPGGSSDVTSPVVGEQGTLTVSVVSITSMTVSWTAAMDEITAQSALEYLVYYSTSNNITTVADMEANGTAVGTYSANITSNSVTGLSGGTTYYFNVIVRDEAGNKAAYTTVSQVTDTPAESVPPTAGNSGTITTSSVGSTSLTLNWTAATDNVSAQGALEYLAYYSTSNNITTVADMEANGTAVGTYTANITSNSVTGLSGGTTYYFNIIVRDEAGNKAAYTTVSQATTAPSDSTPPTAGNSGTITTSSVVSTSLTLNWTAATDNVSAQSALQYLAYYSTSNNITTVADMEANGTSIGSYTSNITTRNVIGLTASATYYFNLIVRDEAGNKTTYSTVSQATSAGAAPSSYIVSGYEADSGHGNGTYNQIANINGKVAYEFDNSVTFTEAVYTILWVTARNRWEIYNDSYYPTEDPGYANGYDYYHPSDTGTTPPTSGWYNYDGSLVAGLTLTP